jgi:hypothetical protein
MELHPLKYLFSIPRGPGRPFISARSAVKSLGANLHHFPPRLARPQHKLDAIPTNPNERHFFHSHALIQGRAARYFLARRSLKVWERV